MKNGRVPLFGFMYIKNMYGRKEEKVMKTKMLKEIKISEPFAKSEPKWEKLEKYRSFWSAYYAQKKPIVIN